MAIKPCELNILHLPIVDWAEKGLDQHIKKTRSLTGEPTFYNCPHQESLGWVDVKTAVEKELISRYRAAGWEVLRLNVIAKSESCRNETTSWVVVQYTFKGMQS